MHQTLFIKILVPLFRWLQSRRKKKEPPKPISHVVVTCTGGIGDILLCTPAIRSIKETFPKARLTAIVHHRKKDLFRFNPHIDQVLELKKSFIHYVRIIRSLNAQPPDSVFIFHINDPFVYCLAYWVCPGNLIGFKSSNPFNFLLNTTVDQEDQKHMIQNYLNLTARIGAKTEDLSRYLKLDPKVICAGEKFFASPETFQNTIGFQLGSGDKRKCWPKEHYVKLGTRLMEELGARVILLGSPKEKELVREINIALKGRAVEAVTDLLTAAGIIRNLNLLITPDTGPMHIAFALNCPTVALCGPSHPKNFGPLDDSGRNIVIHKAPVDEPYVKLSGDFPEVMDQITPGEVFQAARTLLEKNVREAGPCT